MIDPVNNFIACAEMAMKGHAQSNAMAAEAKTPERREYWLNQAKDDAARADFYLRRANEMIELRNQQIEEAA